MSSRSKAIGISGVVMLCALLGACGDDAPSSAATTAPATTSTAASPEGTATGGNAELCEQRDALASSFDDLTSVNIVADGTTGVQEALTEVRTNLQALRATAGDEFRDQAQALDDALQQLEAAVSDSGGVAAVVTAVANVATSGGALLQSLGDLQCD